MAGERIRAHPAGTLNVGESRMQEHHNDNALVVKYQDRDLTFFRRGGRVAVLAVDVEDRLNLKHGAIWDWSRRSEDYRDGADGTTLRGEELIELKSRSLAATVSISGRAPAVLVLFESGFQFYLMRCDHQAAVRFRRWLVEVVIPAFRDWAAGQNASATHAVRTIEQSAAYMQMRAEERRCKEREAKRDEQEAKVQGRDRFYQYKLALEEKKCRVEEARRDDT